MGEDIEPFQFWWKSSVWHFMCRRCTFLHASSTYTKLLIITCGKHIQVDSGLAIIHFKVLFVIQQHWDEDFVILFSCSAVLMYDFEASVFMAVTSCEVSLVTSTSITYSSVINCTCVLWYAETGSVCCIRAEGCIWNTVIARSLETIKR